MNRFRDWYLDNAVEITWFVIGVCFMSGLDALIRENYAGAALNFGIALLNYSVNKR